MKNKVKLQGFVRLQIKENGKIIDDTGFIKNGLTNAARANLTANPITDFDYLAVGTDDTAFAATQTALVAEVTTDGLARAQATASQETTNVTDDTYQLTKTFNAVGTVSVEEGGAFNADSGGTMLGRALTTTKTVINGQQLIVTYKFVFT